MKQNDKLHTVIKKMIDHRVLGSDKYVHNESTWLIFTNEKKWVIELTKEKTLWYNYYFFKKIFDCFKLDVVESQKIITEWVEETIINEVKHTEDGFFRFESTMIDEAIINGVKEISEGLGCESIMVEDTIENGVKSTRISYIDNHHLAEDTLQNGVKRTIADDRRRGWPNIEDAIQNGVKETKGEYYKEIQKVEYTIQNGVKYTMSSHYLPEGEVEYTIENGVKHTGPVTHIPKNIVEGTIQNGVKHVKIGWPQQDNNIEDVIKDGVKKTYSDKIPHEYDWSNQFTEEINDIIENGVKKTEPMRLLMYNPMDFSPEYRENRRLDDVASVLEKGIKEVQPLPSQEGNKDWGNYYHRQEDRTKPHTRYVDDVVSEGKKI